MLLFVFGIFYLRKYANSLDIGYGERDKKLFSIFSYLAKS